MSCELLTVPEAMAILKVSRWTLYNLIRSEEITSIIVGERCRRIPVSALDTYVARLCEEVA
ncbi:MULTISPECIES: helix-turn-helix domain-containing protein [Nonomuraea]|uniref:Excisionase family DNA binding protein n=1 Tax=Nonomuraea roseoviolacea subsp. carminata TaxID=160689 RepID=A0ABT1JZC5_9ACTN|nr:helix-turn-helix domain-containing protein [Nonomuraea roseoviolacea]MCP2347098.1 excisionase family DNA binding protein [Nonomuraea roseoviolacea subsp. carminata]